MLHRAVMDDLHQVDVVQDVALDQHAMGDFDLVVGQRQNQFARRFRHGSETLGQFAAHRHLHVVDDLAQDVGHQRAFAVAENFLVVEEQIADGVDQCLAARDGLIPRELHQNF